LFGGYRTCYRRTGEKSRSVETTVIYLDTATTIHGQKFDPSGTREYMGIDLTLTVQDNQEMPKDGNRADKINRKKPKGGKPRGNIPKVGNYKNKNNDNRPKVGDAVLHQMRNNRTTTHAKG
jgi:hypothetical protein